MFLFSTPSGLLLLGGTSRIGERITMKRQVSFYSRVEIYLLKKLSSVTAHKRWLVLITVALSAMTSTSYSKEYDNSLVLTENTAVEVAVRDNPNLAEMQARYKALSEVPSQVGTLPDPMVNLNAMNFPSDTFDRDQEAMTQAQIGFSQVFPFPGKLSLKEEAAEYDALAAGHTVEEVRLQLIRNVKGKWWQLYYLDRALETVGMNQSLLRQFIAVAKTKYETGKGLQQDVLLAQLELSKLIDQNIQRFG